MFFGYRVQLQRQAAPYPYPEVVLSYCAGPHRAWVEALVTVRRASLCELDPMTTTPYLLSRYPSCDVKPMASDGKCWRAVPARRPGLYPTGRGVGQGGV